MVSWNVAAVNNNPFEYWITHPNPEYKRLMENMEDFIGEPGERDVPVHTVFSDEMTTRLLGKLEEHGHSRAQLDAVEAMWRDDYRGRKIVSEFLKDGKLGKKRLVSMPDRVSNTIQSASKFVYRPAVTNCYAENLRSMDEWFAAWLEFFFDTDVTLPGEEPRKVVSMLGPIRRAKYPTVTEAEEAVSLPLQVLVLGIFDAVLLHFVTLASPGTWHQLRTDIAGSLNARKNERIVAILQSTYHDTDALFLQEVGNELSGLLRDTFKDTHTLVLPQSWNAKRNQNSLLLLRSSIFTAVREVEVPVDGVEAGDLLVAVAQLAGREVALASFHGDTNGLLSLPVLDGVVAAMRSGRLPARLLFGLDANTYERDSDGSQYVVPFEAAYLKHELKACWGSPVNPSLYTTFNARTFLQPQLNKAARSTELVSKGDRNPKDFILFTKDFSTASQPVRDNTGEGRYVDDMVFPTLTFPSDHAVVSVYINLERETEEL